MMTPTHIHCMHVWWKRTVPLQIQWKRPETHCKYNGNDQNLTTNNNGNGQIPTANTLEMTRPIETASLTVNTMETASPAANTMETASFTVNTMEMASPTANTMETASLTVNTMEMARVPLQIQWKQPDLTSSTMETAAHCKYSGKGQSPTAHTMPSLCYKCASC